MTKNHTITHPAQTTDICVTRDSMDTARWAKILGHRLYVQKQIGEELRGGVAIPEPMREDNNFFTVCAVGGSCGKMRDRESFRDLSRAGYLGMVRHLVNPVANGDTVMLPNKHWSRPEYAQSSAGITRKIQFTGFKPSHEIVDECALMAYVKDGRLQPIGQWYLLLPDYEIEAEKCGFTIADKDQFRSKRCWVIAAGAGIRAEDGQEIPMLAKKGDYILTSMTAGYDIRLDKSKYRMVREGEILAILDPKELPHAEKEYSAKPFDKS